MSSCFYAANKAHLIMLVPGLFALTLKLFSKPLSKEWYWFENVPLVTRVLKTCVHASIILKKSKNILFKIYAVCLALTGWPFYGEPYCFNIGFILFVITIVSTHLNCPAAIHWIFMRENESLPLKLVKFRRNKKRYDFSLRVPTYCYCRGLSSLIYSMTKLEPHQEVATVAVDWNSCSVMKCKY